MDKPRVFISYCHDDVQWLRDLELYLEGLDVEPWEDTRIKPGELWRDEIAHAIEGADAAVLLVTQRFIRSKFIQEVELPALLRRYHGSEKLFWILCEHAHYEKQAFEGIQAAHDVGKPLRPPPRQAATVCSQATSRGCRTSRPCPPPPPRSTRSEPDWAPTGSRCGSAP